MLARQFSAFGLCLFASASPVTASSFQWDGGYVGGGVGVLQAENKWTTTAVVPSIGASVGADSSADFNALGARLGILTGYNWRIGSDLLLGLEVDFGGGNANSTPRLIPGSDIWVFGTHYTANRPETTITANWDASLRSRFGYFLSPESLLYGSVGYSLQKVTVNAHCVRAAICTFAHNESAEKVLSGWTLGAGVEKRISGNWLFRADYRYAKFGKFEHTFFNDGLISGGIDDRMSSSIRTSTHMFSLGLLYKF